MSKFLFLVWFLIIICSTTEAQGIRSYTFSECDQSCDFEKVINRISYQSFNEKTLKISFGHISNCAGIHNPSATYYNDTLEIKYDDFITEIDTLKHYDSLLNDSTTLEITEIIETQPYVLCDCYFESEFEISGVNKNPLKIILNGTPIQYYPDKYKVQSIEFELVDGDTVNLIDKFGYRQGLWIKKHSNNQLIFNRIYEADVIVEGTDYHYHENGNIKSKLKWVNNEHSDFYEYDLNGNITTHKKSPFEN